MFMYHCGQEYFSINKINKRATTLMQTMFPYKFKLIPNVYGNVVFKCKQGSSLDNYLQTENNIEKKVEESNISGVELLKMFHYYGL